MTTTLVLEPRDGLFFKDGRGWFTSSSGRAVTLPWPYPSTMRGVLRSAWGLRQEQNEGRRFTKDDWLQRTDVDLEVLMAMRREGRAPWSAEHRVWPTPLDALYTASGVERLEPAPSEPGYDALDHLVGDPARAALWYARSNSPDKPLAPPRWWSEDTMRRWLGGGVDALDAQAHRCPEPVRRRQIHLAIDRATGTARERFLYSTEVLEALDAEGGEWALAVRYGSPAGDASPLSEPMTAGGKRRLLYPARPDSDVLAMPSGVARRSTGLRLYLVTPAHFGAGWLPDGFDAAGDRYLGTLPGVSGGVRLLAAIVGRPQHVSGWDIARGKPKATKRLVPPGSVYYFTKTDGSVFDEAELAALWLARIGSGTEEGFGLCAPAPWEPPRADGGGEG